VTAAITPLPGRVDVGVGVALLRRRERFARLLCRRPPARLSSLSARIGTAVAAASSSRVVTSSPSNPSVRTRSGKTARLGDVDCWGLGRGRFRRGHSMRFLDQPRGLATMEFGIIGAGFIGGTLARKLASAGHRVRIANSKGPTSLTEFDGEEGITPMWAGDAVDGVDVAILSVPQNAVARLPQSLVSALSSVPIVIDTGNYYPVRDGRIDAIDRGMPDSEWVASRLGRPVFKVFNNISAPSLKHKGTTDADKRLGLTVAGPATEDKEKVFFLVRQLGFEPVDAGALEESWRLQPGTPTYTKDMNAHQLRAGLAKTTRADIAKYEQNRDELQDFDAAAKRQRERMSVVSRSSPARSPGPTGLKVG
jgi:8-hydroxy-5-deazaflavin:NADPH oxidoreductase